MLDFGAEVSMLAFRDMFVTVLAQHAHRAPGLRARSAASCGRC